MTAQDQINKILWDRRVLIIPTDVDAPRDIEYVILKNFSLADRNYYLTIRELEENKARSAGVLSEADLMETARQSGYWTKDDDDVEARADSHIAFLESEFEAKKKFKSRQNIIKLQIEDSKAKRAATARKRNEIKLNSSEYLAHEIAAFQLLRRAALRPDSSLLFPDDKTFFEYKNEYLSFIYFLIGEMMSEGMMETSVLRSIARSVEWRLIWTLNRENLQSIFACGIGDLNLNQKMLIYWSRVYDSAIESTDPPDKETIEDDAVFDEWLINRNNKPTTAPTVASKAQEQGRVLDGEFVEACTCGAKQKNKGKYLGEKIRHDDTCRYGTWHQYTEQEREIKARGIYSENPKQVRQIINHEQEMVSTRGMVSEQQLRAKTRPIQKR